jgi:hypothetical protein
VLELFRPFFRTFLDDVNKIGCVQNKSVELCRATLVAREEWCPCSDAHYLRCSTSVEAMMRMVMSNDGGAQKKHSFLVF